MIDSYKTVVRLKGGFKDPPEHFGTRTDVICARSHLFEIPGAAFWYCAGDIEDRLKRCLSKWSYAKPSTGLCAIYCAVEFLKPESIALIGFDLLLHGKPGKYNDMRRTGFSAHDARAEGECLRSLPVRIVDLSESNAKA